MKAERFEVRAHAVLRETQIVEVFGLDGRLLATIYPNERGIHVVSKYLTAAIDLRSPAGTPSVLLMLSEE